MSIVVVDNGSGEVKCGLPGETSPRYVGPNCTATLERQLRVLVADEISSIRNQSALKYTRPCERGQLTNVGCESEVWGHMFGKMDIRTTENVLVVTEPPLSPPQLGQSLDELIFEEFQFPAAYRCPAGRFASVAAAAELEPPRATLPTFLLVDFGYSATHVTPVVGGDFWVSGIRRHCIGGKALTGYLRELVSYRQFHMMDETVLLDDVKKKLLFVSQDFDADLALCDDDDDDDDGHELRVEYELPDYSTVPMVEHRMNDLLDDDDHRHVLTLESERFAVPEILFSPRDIGLQQAGVADLAVDAILSGCPPELHQALSSNVVICGGGAKLPGLEARLYSDLRTHIPGHLTVDVRTLQEPAFAAFRGAALVALTPDLASYCTTREAWFESGPRRRT